MPVVEEKQNNHIGVQRDRRTVGTWVLTIGVQDPDFRTGTRQDSAHFEQTGSDPDYGFIRFIQVSGSGFSKFHFWD